MKQNVQLKPTQIYTLLKDRKRNLETVMESAKKNLAAAPDGKLHTIAKNGGASFQYYLRNPEETSKEIYLKKSEKSLIRNLAGKKYNMDIISAALKEIAAIDRFLARVDRDSIIESYTRLSPGEQMLVNPFIYDDSSYIACWESFQYTGRGFVEDAPDYYTEKNERVRSKSEILIANALSKHGIPYRYECPITLSDGIIIYPDFTVLRVDTRQVFYWEHLGMMDDMDYVRNAIRKIESFERSGIYPGKNLILTHETSKNPLGIPNIEKVIENYLT